MSGVSLEKELTDVDNRSSSSENSASDAGIGESPPEFADVSQEDTDEEEGNFISSQGGARNVVANVSGDTYMTQNIDSAVGEFLNDDGSNEALSHPTELSMPPLAIQAETLKEFEFDNGMMQDVKIISNMIADRLLFCLEVNARRKRHATEERLAGFVRLDSINEADVEEEKEEVSAQDPMDINRHDLPPGSRIIGQLLRVDSVRQLSEFALAIHDSGMTSERSYGKAYAVVSWSAATVLRRLESALNTGQRIRAKHLSRDISRQMDVVDTWTSYILRSLDWKIAKSLDCMLDAAPILTLPAKPAVTKALEYARSFRVFKAGKYLLNSTLFRKNI